MATFIQGHTVVDRDLRRQFKRLDEKIRAKALQKTTESGKPTFLEAMHAHVPRETGALDLSLGDKSKQYRKKGVSMAIIGARVGFAVDVEVTLKDQRGRVVGRRRMRRDPARYIHLADQYHDFIRAAFESSKHEAMARGMETLRTETKKAIEAVGKGA